jgi:hypothetical protein
MDLARSAEAVSVEVLAETISECDPASPGRATTKLGYAMTLGRTGGLSR